MATSSAKNLKQQIINNLNLSGFTSLQQSKIISGLMDNVSDRINIAILDLLAEDEKKELGKIARSKKKGAALKYLNSKIKNISSLTEKITRETIEDFRRLRRKKSTDI
ncbi:MAG: hypothetical protein CEN87_125 [Parcubacteria group bacterium Licking1014_1]|nr:MAG: hypothetical protein CEN87_125 [Parcubacteria group bacterium Licking1014_1]